MTYPIAKILADQLIESQRITEEAGDEDDLSPLIADLMQITDPMNPTAIELMEEAISVISIC